MRQPHLAPVVAIIVITFVSLALLGHEGLLALVARWQAPEYSHGPAIPFLVLYLLALRALALSHLPAGGSWAGLLAFAASLVLIDLGERTGFPSVTQSGLVLATFALVWAFAGLRALQASAAPLLLLVFLVPLPLLVEERVTGSLQALSASIGVEGIRLAGQQAFRSGNVIDLGGYQLLVAEACSGLRYLAPLLAFSTLCAILFRGPWWQRALLALAAVPVAVLMNGLRISVTGVLVHHFGPGQAEGFLHYFEGWVMFLACVVVLFALAGLLARLAGHDAATAFAAGIPARSGLAALVARFRPGRPATAAALLALAAALLVDRPPEQPPPRAALATFPRDFGGWRGEELPVGAIAIVNGVITDRLLAMFGRAGEGAPVELGIAYCASQRPGTCGHPSGLAPASAAYAILDRGTLVLTGVGTGAPLPVRRTVLVREDSRRLVYDWYEGRGRRHTGELARDFGVFLDSLARRRTDGAQVRVTTTLTPDESLDAADRRLARFVSALLPELGPHLPD